MKRCAIIVHSITGNCYIMGKYLQDKLISLGIDARLYKVKDDDLHIWANIYDTTNEYYEEIESLANIGISSILKSDAVILGCSSIFSNVSSNMMSFFEKTKEEADKESFKDKLFSCFGSSSTGLEDSKGTLIAMHNWAKAHKMNKLKLQKEIEDGVLSLGANGIEYRPSSEIEKQLDLLAKAITDQIL